MDKLLHTRATLQLTASGKSPRVSIRAYTGKPMRVAGRNVVIDLATIKLPQQIPILIDHTETVDGIAGHGVGRIERNALIVEGQLVPSAPAARKIIELAKAGVELQASIGLNFSNADAQSLRSGASINLNGRTIKAAASGLLAIFNGTLKETSILPLGADDETAVRVAAKRGSKMAKRKQNPIVNDQAHDDDDDVAADGTIIDENEDVTAADDDNDSSRIRAIREVCMVPAIQGGRRVVRHMADIEERAISERWDVNQTALEVLRASRPQAMPRMYGTGQGSSIGVAAADGKNLIAAAVMLHAGKSSLAEKSFGAQVAQRAADLRCNSMLDLCAASLRTEMRDIPRGQNELIKAAFSTASLPNALGSFADKLAADAYNESPGAWRPIVRRRTVNNFREHKIIRMVFVGNFEDVPNGGEIAHGRLEDESLSAQAGTKGLMLGITRHDVINDDLGLFADVSVALGKADARTKSDDFVIALFGNAGSFFGAGNGNVGTDSLDATSLGAAIANMAKRRDSKGRNIDVRARVLLVPPELEFAAVQILKSAEVMRYVSSSIDNAPTANPLSAALDLQVDPRLSNDERFDDASATGWYLFGAPSDGAVNLALLNGRETPIIEQQDAPFNMLGVQYRGYSDHGFSLGENVAAFFSTGAS